MYNCDCCNFHTNLRSNYNRHLKTKKHHEKIIQLQNIEPIITDNIPIITNNY